MIQFNSQKNYYKNPFGPVERNSSLCLRIKAAGESAAVSACLLIVSDADGSIIKAEAKPVLINKNGLIPTSEKDILFDFSVQIDTVGLYFYHFEVTYENGEKEQTPPYQLTVYSEDYTTPKWLKDGVMYQIFPDRFARNRSYKAPSQNKNYCLREDWGGIPNDKPDQSGIIQNNDFFGGNLKGIAENLDYLETLGVTVIYLNPIFEAYSNHRYDTADYKKIDPLLGTEEDFRELCTAAGQKGIRIVLDGVFNHTGSDSLYFNKKGRYPELGAYQSKESPYFGWYRFIDFPDKYEAWWGIDTLPDINESDPSYLDYILRSEDSVVKHWLRCGASGFRLDVADELPDEFLEELRKAVKEVSPDAAVIGEVWEDASNKISYGKRRKYFLGGQLDSVMNYPLKDALIHYLIDGKDGIELEKVVNGLWENYPKAAFDALMNIMGTHDTVRILTVLGTNSKDDAYTRQRLFLMLLISAFMPGIPCIYYGDEIGMQGGGDPFNRKCFDPEHGDPAILRFYRRLFAFRKKIGSLSEYAFHPRTAEGSFYSFSRISTEGRLVIAVNSGSQDYLLNLAMKEKETLKDFFISGTVTYERQGVFRIKENSGIAVWICPAPW